MIFQPLSVHRTNKQWNSNAPTHYETTLIRSKIKDQTTKNRERIDNLSFLISCHEAALSFLVRWAVERPGIPYSTSYRSTTVIHPNIPYLSSDGLEFVLHLTEDDVIVEEETVQTDELQFEGRRLPHDAILIKMCTVCARVTFLKYLGEVVEHGQIGIVLGR